MNKVYLLIGGNIGNRMANLQLATAHIVKEIGTLFNSSSVYETEAWGPIEQPLFLNQVLVVETKINATSLLTHLLFIEKKMGRNRDVPMGPRTIDIDILYFNDEIINSPDLTIPHPRISERKFVLLPLNEIAPTYVHPVLHKNNALLLKECGDSLAVYKKTEI
jgi:2-amino-4-hydroxy-6-hydroxymethyldihydropteridine diphosphokinase